MLFRISPLFFAVVALAAADPAGVPNFHKVNETVYRGAQPTAEGFRSLAALGVKTVVDLRGSEHSEADEKRLVEAAGMRYVSIPMKGMATPSDEQIASALKELNDPAAGPVFVHCKRGADRTGAVVACYRISHYKWDSGKALNEASGFGMSWYQIALRRYVDRFAGNTLPAGIPATLASAH
jgi:tyrosine-protein phosphatase SIW14